MRVTRGTGWLRHRVADLMGLPQAGEDVPLELEVRVEGTREHWIRRFGANPFVTTQWLDGDTLIEASGPVRFAFRLSGDPRGMTFEFRRCWCFFLPLPRFLSPRIRAATASHTDGWQIEVQIDTPMLGLLVRYEGLVTPLVADLKSDSIATSGDTLARRSSV